MLDAADWASFAEKVLWGRVRDRQPDDATCSTRRRPRAPDAESVMARDSRGPRPARTRSRRSARRTVRRGWSNRGFHRGVPGLEEIFSTPLDRGVAIRLPMAIDAHTFSTAVHVPERPIVWGGDEVPIGAMMALSKDSHEKLGALFEALIRVLSKCENVGRLAGQPGRTGSTSEDCCW